jgi:hypothetical protein
MEIVASEGGRSTEMEKKSQNAISDNKVCPKAVWFISVQHQPFFSKCVNYFYMKVHLSFCTENLIQYPM